MPVTKELIDQILRDIGLEKIEIDNDDRREAKSEGGERMKTK